MEGVGVWADGFFNEEKVGKIKFKLGSSWEQNYEKESGENWILPPFINLQIWAGKHAA